VRDAKERKTDILRLRCIVFLKEGRVIAHSDPNLHLTDFVSITFECQKKDEKNDTVTQRATRDATLCPILMWARLVRRIADTPVSAVWRNGQIDHITAEEMVRALEAAVESIGYDKLNIKKGQIGTHSIPCTWGKSQFTPL
jgi:hypothetical protein